MRALILLAHGSRREESAQEVVQMAQELEVRAGKTGQFDTIKPAFMQFCGPNFYQVVDQIIQDDLKQRSESESEDNLKEILVLPYFISAGSHVAEDIPELIKKAVERYPDISFKVTPHLGKFQGLTRLILEEA